ncbi:MAG: hypothetical protein BM565_00765 [Gammaproteobacteria bacterium MedPE]|nr:MAG: hypothetical protein BM565_00765 [Gammaproteobacteria bacterium MedPE]
MLINLLLRKCHWLALIGVLPDFQHGHDVGKALIQMGIRLLKGQGCNAFFIGCENVLSAIWV